MTSEPTTDDPRASDARHRDAGAVEANGPRPAERALVPFDAQSVEQASDPAGFVVACCQHAKIWLARALERGEIERIAELKAQAEAVRIYSEQQKLGKDAELAAAEVVRRATDGLGRAVKQGQAAGEIRTRGRPAQGKNAPRAGDFSASPSDYFTSHHEMEAAYATADLAPDRFEEVLTAAKAEGNLSQANVMRKAAGDKPVSLAVRREQKLQELRVRKLATAGHTVRYIAGELAVSERAVRAVCRRLGVAPADAVMGRTRRLDANRIVNETVMTLESLLSGLSLVDFDQLDLTRLDAWAGSLTQSLRGFDRFCNQLKEMTHGNRASS